VAARSFCEQSLAAFRQLRDAWGIASTLSDLASLSCDQGNNTEARRLYGESLKMFQELGHQRGIARVLECLAVSAAAQSNAEHSLHLAGAAAALRQRLGAPLTATEQVKLEKALEFARRALGNAPGLTAWMEGWAMPVQQALQEALNCDAESKPSDWKPSLSQLAVPGSIMRRTAETRFAGKPPRRACSRTISSSGARYTQ